jgi:peptide/nickel transport system substrate-binding protein
MARSSLFRKTVSTLLAVSALSFGLVAAAPPSPGGASTPTTVTWAEAPNSAPNFIFPFMNLQYFSVANISQFQYLMFRPLYWFGSGDTPDLNTTLSLADSPVYSDGGTTVTINLKPYSWSNGEQVTAQDVMFFLNMLHAEKTNWAAYAPGGSSIPDSIQAATVVSPSELQLTLTKPFNNFYFTYNQLGQITPLPVAWDKTSTSGASGSGGCSAAAYGTADAACTKVYTFLSKESGYDPAKPKAANNALPTYATNKLWQVVDGPYHLTAFNSNGDVTMQANSKYSGPEKPSIQTFKELPFTSDSAEYNALVGGQVNYGYLPPEDITAQAKTPFTPGANNPRLASKFTLNPLYAWAINYFPYNFDSTGDGGNAGKIFSQLYFRQAMQYLVDQPLYIKRVNHGYGVPTYGPVPTEPPNNYASSLEKSNPYPYDVSKAKELLSSHGWNVVPNGTSTCQSPGSASNQCGTGIPKGAKLAFTIQYATGAAATTNTMNAEKSSWAQAGINITLTSASFDTVIGNATPCPKGCSWEMANWGAGWIFSPDYYPSGEEIFQTGAGSNSGNYSDQVNDANIVATNNTDVSLTQYEDYLAQQLPVVWQPNYANPMNEIQKTLKGTQPANVLDALTPENWHWAS